MTDLAKWVVVPVEPAQEMLWREEAPFEPWRVCKKCGTETGMSKNSQTKFWNAMLAARPTGPDVPVLIDAGELERLRAGVKRIAELRYSDAGEPFDEALDIADALLEPEITKESITDWLTTAKAVISKGPKK